MPTRDEPRLTLRLGFALDGRLDGAAEGVGVKKGTLARRAIELGLEGAVEEARVARVERELLVAQRAARRGARVDGSPAARGGRRGAAGGGDGNGDAAGRSPGRAAKLSPPPAALRLDGIVAERAGGMLEARRAVNAGLVRVDGVVVRDPMTLVPAGARVVVES